MKKISFVLFAFVVLLLTACSNAKGNTPAHITIIGDGNIVTGESVSSMELADENPIEYTASLDEDVIIRYECSECGYNETFSVDEVSNTVIKCRCKNKLARIIIHVEDAED